MTQVDIRQIVGIGDPAREGFVDVYREVFGGAPYFEPYAPEQVIEQVWEPLVPECVFVAQDGERVVALGCAHARLANINGEIRDFLLAQPELSEMFDPARTVHMAELAVRVSHRKQGIASRLIRIRLEWALAQGNEWYEMCTDADFSMSRPLYERIGARLAPFTQDISGPENVSASVRRIFLYGRIDEAIRRLESMRII